MLRDAIHILKSVMTIERVGLGKPTLLVLHGTNGKNHSLRHFTCVVGSAGLMCDICFLKAGSFVSEW